MQDFWIILAKKLARILHDSSELLHLLASQESCMDLARILQNSWISLYLCLCFFLFLFVSLTLSLLTVCVQGLSKILQKLSKILARLFKHPCGERLTITCNPAHSQICRSDQLSSPLKPGLDSPRLWTEKAKRQTVSSREGKTTHKLKSLILNVHSKDLSTHFMKNSQY